MAPKAQRRSSAATTASQVGCHASNGQEEQSVVGASGRHNMPRPRAVGRVRGRHSAADECCIAAPGRRGGSVQYWQARLPCPLYAGPLGEVVGQVECGTVVAEQARCEDRFGGWWLGTLAEDGSLVWVSYSGAENGELATQHTQPPHWQRVRDERADHLSEDGATPVVQPIVLRAARPAWMDLSKDSHEDDETCDKVMTAAHAMTFDTLASLVGLGSDTDVPTWIELYDYYWTTVAQPTPTSTTSRASTASTLSPRLSESLNVRYQAALERLLWDCDGEKAAAEMALHDIVRKFEADARAAAVCVVEDLLRPASIRVTRPHTTYRHVFYHGDLVVWLCIDTTMGLYGGQRGAEKAATHAFRSYQLFALTAPRRLLSVPLMAHVTFAGHTMFISSVPPVGHTTCVYAPLRTALRASHDNQDDTTPVTPPPLVERLMGEVASMLHLAPHDVAVSGLTWHASLPADVEVYAGRDRRLYVLNVARMLPPLLPLIRDHTSPAATAAVVGSASPVELALHGMRPELLLRQGSTSSTLVNPDVALLVDCSGNSGASSETDLRVSCRLSEMVRQDVITRVAGMVGLVLPVSPPTPRAPVAGTDVDGPTFRCCTLCQRALDDGDEVCFVVCRNVRRCCRVCVHCYGARMAAARRVSATSSPMHAKHGADDASRPDDLHDAVRCEAGPRPSNGCLLEPCVCSLLHRNGLSLCYLPYVYYRLPTASAAFVRPFCELEMLARGARRVLQERLRRHACTAQDALRVVEQFLVTLLQPGGEEAERLWSKELGPEMRRSFPAIVAPFDAATVSPLLLLERLQELCGVTLTESSLASLQSSIGAGNAFVQLSRIQPRVKRLPLPGRLTPAEDRGDDLDEWLQAVLEDVLLLWIAHAPSDCDDTIQPFYLRDAAMI